MSFLLRSCRKKETRAITLITYSFEYNNILTNKLLLLLKTKTQIRQTAPLRAQIDNIERINSIRINGSFLYFKTTY